MGRDLVGPLDNVPCQAEHCWQGRKLLRRQVHQFTQRNESGSLLVAPDALGRVDEPAEPREDAEQHVTPR